VAGRLTVCVPILAWLLAGPATGVDGTLPPFPYRFLHPPPGLTRKNEPPTEAIRALPPDYAQAVNWFTFTPDNQAGIAAPRGAVAPEPGTQEIAVRVTPVDAPPGLPTGLALDGNAYRIYIRDEPSEHMARLRRPVNLTLRFPHEPVGIYVYRAGRWTKLCGEADSALTGATVSCPTRVLGIVAAVTLPANLGPASGRTGTSTWLGHHLAVVLGAGSVLLAAVLAYRARTLRRRTRA
jgi:hypothetical protein